MNLVSEVEQQRRIAICRACKNYKPMNGLMKMIYYFSRLNQKLGTCGKFLKGGKDGDAVLCGCVMEIKVNLDFAECPIKKW